MKILCFIFLVHSVFAQFNFGTSYLKSSRLCHQWTCLNNKLGLPDALPPKEQYASMLQSLLPAGPWQEVAGTVADLCYGERPRRYTNTCPGQALMHCAVDNLAEHCPEEYWRKDDACAPVSTLAGFKYLFSQSRYENLEKYLPSEIRPSWFLKNYFNKRCCDLPQLFNSTTLTECGVTTFMHYYNHEPRDRTASSFRPVTTSTQKPKEAVEITTKNSSILSSNSNENRLHIVSLPTVDDIQTELDPLSCCDMSDFISPTMRSECDFHLTVGGDLRLAVRNTTTTTIETTTVTSKKRKMSNDVKVVPVSCEKETCVFKKLNVITESGSLDTDAFTMLLHNLTYNYPAWTKAKARVVTKCLTRPIHEYVADCEINRVLGCVFDVLSENCPDAKKMDPCKHTTSSSGKMMCQINSSKYRPKNRRMYCGLPSLVNRQVLSECDMTSVSKLEYVPEPAVTVRPDKRKWMHFQAWCKEAPEPMTCVLNKMGVLNKFSFLDYFKMKDYLKAYMSKHPDWLPLSDVLMGVFMESPIYSDHCISSRKMLNVLHSMLVTCPLQRRSSTTQCQKLFIDLSNSSDGRSQLPNDKMKDSVRKVVEDFRQAYESHFASALASRNVNNNKQTDSPMYTPKIYPFFENNLQPVSYLSVKPTPVQGKGPLIVLPVYLRLNFTRPINKDGTMWRSAPVS